MKSKSKILFLSSAILVLVASLVFALTLALSTPEALSNSVNSTSFIIQNAYAFPVNITLIMPLTISDGSVSVPVSLSTPSTFTISASNSSTINISRGIVPSSLKLGTFSSDIQVNTMNAENSSQSDSMTIPLQFINSFCDEGDVGSGLEITRIRDETKDNKNEWEWKPIDNIEITTRVKNNANDDLDVVVEYGLYDVDDDEFLDLNDDTIDVSVNEDEYEDVTIEFQVPAGIDSTHDFRFYVKAYEDGEEDTRCTDKKAGAYYETIDISQNSRDVIVSNINAPDTSLCGETVTIDARVYNVGRKDEDRVKVTLYNKELGVNLNKEIKNLDSGDNSDVSFSFQIPETASEKTYTLLFGTQFNYDDNDDTYDDVSANSFDALVKVEGNCQQQITAEDVRITAVLDSAAKAGSQIIIRANIQNTGDKTTSYTLQVSGIDSFASLDRIEPSTFTLNSGQSQDVLVYLNANDDASGDYTFNIRAIFAGKTKEQPVSLSIEGKSSSITGLAVFDSIKSNWFIAVIVLVNIILIVLIIVVAVRIAKG